MPKNNYLGLQISVVALFFLFVFPNIVRDGMFQDGLYYATIGHNMANGIGSFWAPKLTETFFLEFFEHPPLALGIQSILFTLFGSSIFVERIFVALVAILSLYLIIAIWRIVFKDDKTLIRFWFVPVFLWLIDENTFLSYAANLLDCAMGVFTLASIYSLLKSVSSPAGKHRVLYILLGSFLVLLAFLTKGPVGLFPLAFFFIYLIAYQEISFKLCIGYSVLLVAGLLAAFGILVIFEEPREFLFKYIDIQVLAALKGERVENIHNRWYIVKRFFEMGLAPIFLTITLFGLTSWKQRKLNVVYKKEFRFFILTALSASLPIIISPKQAGFYIVPAQPFFYLAFAALILPVLSKYFNKLVLKENFLKRSKIISGVLIVGTIVFIAINVGEINKRDNELIPDVHKIASITGKDVILGCKKPDPHSYSIGYFYRYHFISIDTTNHLSHEFLIVRKKADTIAIPDFSRIDLDTYLYNLYNKND